MPNTISSVRERLYITKESTFGTAVSPTNSNACRFISCTITPVQAEIQRPDKNLDEDEPAGSPGRRSCTWNIRLSMAGSGAAGTAPDCGPLIEAAMGKAAVTVSSTSVTYGLGSLKQSLNIWKYDETGLAQVVLGAIVASMKVDIVGDVPILEFSGEGYWAYDSAQAADGSTPSAAKGGLGSWPTEPSTPVFNGIPPAGFDGVITLDGNTYTTFLTGTINLSSGRQLPKDGFSMYPTAPVTGMRVVTEDLALKEDDSSNLTSLMQKAISKTALNNTLQVGSVAGNIWSWTAKNILLNPADPDPGQIQRHIVFRGSHAHPTSANAKDHLVLVLT